MHIFGMLEEIGVYEENPHRHGMNMQTVHRYSGFIQKLIFFFVINIITKQDWMKQHYSRNFCTCFYLCIWCVQLPFSVLVGIWTWSKSWILSDHTCEDGREIRWQESRFQTFEFNSWLLSLDLTGEKKKSKQNVISFKPLLYWYF